MADIEIRRGRGGKTSIVINGVDYSLEIYRDIALVEVGDDPMTSEAGLRVTFAVSHLTLDADCDVQITDRFPEVAQRVRSIAEAD